MKCLTRAECEKKVQDLHLEIEGQFLRRIARRLPATQEFVIPDSARRQALAVNAIFGAFEGQTSEWLLWAVEWGIWPNEEYPDLADQIRQFHGEHRHLGYAPGHVFSREEKPLAQGMMRLAMLFGWTAFLIPVPAAFVVFFDDDQFMSVDAADPSDVSGLVANIKEVFAEWKSNEMSPQ